MNKQTIYIIIGVIVLAVVGWLILSRGNSSSTSKKTDSTDQKSNSEEQPKVSESNNTTNEPCERTFKDSDLASVVISPQDKFVTMNVKGYGEIKIELNRAVAPKSSENFIKLSKAGFYNCLTFHRIADGFVIQGGDPSGDGTGGPGYTIPAEIKLPHTKGAIAMARTGDQVNPERASSGSQFYIALSPLEALDGQYTVFGQVVSGLDVVDAIGKAKISSPAGDGPPVEPIIIESAVVSAE